MQTDGEHFNCPRCGLSLAQDGEGEAFGIHFRTFTCPKCIDVMADFGGKKLNTPIELPFTFCVDATGKWFAADSEAR